MTSVSMNRVLRAAALLAIMVACVGSLAFAAAANATIRKVAHDFNHDGNSDLLWQAAGTGSTVMWLMNGTSLAVPPSAFALGGSTDWSVVATGDFNGDGYADLIWRQASTGYTVMWLMNGASLPNVMSAAFIGGDPGWSVVATGDFNGDGKTDLIWHQASTGATVMWLMNGASVLQAISLGTSTDWSVAATGDFNGDGATDLVWRQNSTGAIVVWLLNGSSLPNILGAASIGGSSAWTVAATGDFNGDGKDDLVWRNASTGATWIWFMNGITATASLKVSTGTDWSIIGTGDFNGDGITDVVWQQASTGATVVWLLNGATTGSIAATAATLGTSNSWAVTNAGGGSANGTAALTWTAPTQNADGSTLTDLSGYKIYHGLSASALSDVVVVPGASASGYTFSQLNSGTHYFAVTSYNSAGTESAQSGVASKAIP
jgi:FG-GAP-like repeat/FG-GAP repeat